VPAAVAVAVATAPVLPTAAPAAPVPAAPVPEKRIYITAANRQYIEAAVNAVASLHHYEPNIPKIVYVWPDVPKEHYEILAKYGATEVRILPTTQPSATPWSDFWEPQHFAWKLWVFENALKEAESGTSILYLDAGVAVASSLDSIWSHIDTAGVFILDDATQTNARWCHPAFCKNLQVTDAELAANQIAANLVGFKKGHPSNAFFAEVLKVAQTQRDSIVGEKWTPYSAVCMGHRHDQSILSVLSQRARLPRLPLSRFYCDVSMRAAQQLGMAFYVHRGNFKDIKSFTDGIDEAYVINLPRRTDRLESFKDAH
jgi:hypothetical protein